MKTDPSLPTERRLPSVARREPFAQSLQQAAPRGQKAPRQPLPLPSTPQAQLAAGVKQAHGIRELVAAGDRTARTLQRARTGHEAQEQGLGERRDHFGAREQVHGNQRAAERIAAELGRGPAEERALPVISAQPTAHGFGGAQQPGTPAPPATRVEAAMELVTKIEVWLKSTRPALTLGVAGALNSEVTVERTGPGRVSLSFRGKNGPPSHSDVRAVRDALERRGLLLTSVRIS